MLKCKKAAAHISYRMWYCICSAAHWFFLPGEVRNLLLVKLASTETIFKQLVVLHLMFLP